MIGNIYVILVGRIIYGIGCGIFSVFVPKFSNLFTLVLTLLIVNETAPTEIKGTLGVLT